MGLYDSVYVKCPKCGKRSELQTKVRCDMKTYDGESVPADIAKGVDGDEFNCCGTTWRVKSPKIPHVELKVKPAARYNSGG